MSTTTCPNCGAASSTPDYCDQCGAALTTAAPPASDVAAPTGAPAEAACPNCGAARTPGDAFCEGCGLDFATGQMPVAPPAAAAPGASDVASEWVAVVDADRAFFDSNEAEGPTSVVFPDGVGPREVPLTGDEVVIGRRSESRGFFPGIDLSTPVSDPAVSHHHADLRRQVDGSWAVIDERSTNGTWLNGAARPLDHGVLTALREGDRLNIGSFTRITIRRRGGQTP